ncbi:hypothetical protein BDZ90DRAFT_182300 [Jaminaea rosea]|uniref:Uncharacterized protein n=1 Tax=Jaminaea rosea TaxID=1569628 RepID=A0A316UQI2_9BASI|nr:hypothetical protein BDZ90DRAFT_182300 [Jaminaea rosea]PWN27569.1 hypothetical protein BDZ90DRAFT_182300 [Jaminaea rosea]
MSSSNVPTDMPCHRCYTHDLDCIPGEDGQSCTECAKKGEGRCNAGGRIPCYTRDTDLRRRLYIAAFRASFLDSARPDPINPDSRELARSAGHDQVKRLYQYRRANWLGPKSNTIQQELEWLGWRLNFAKGPSHWRAMPELFLGKRAPRPKRTVQPASSSNYPSLPMQGSAHSAVRRPAQPSHAAKPSQLVLEISDSSSSGGEQAPRLQPQRKRVKPALANSNGGLTLGGIDPWASRGRAIFGTSPRRSALYSDEEEEDEGEAEVHAENAVIEKERGHCAVVQRKSEEQQEGRQSGVAGSDYDDCNDWDEPLPDDDVAEEVMGRLLPLRLPHNEEEAHQRLDDICTLIAYLPRLAEGAAVLEQYLVAGGVDMGRRRPWLRFLRRRG